MLDKTSVQDGKISWLKETKLINSLFFDCGFDGKGVKWRAKIVEVQISQLILCLFYIDYEIE